MALQILHSSTDPQDVTVNHTGKVIPLTVPAPHIREVKAALLTIRKCDRDSQEFMIAFDTLERFIYTR